ncbi:MAG TPA: DUF1499 domain-containing protein [Verrucomicrobiota bacterium]|nr:DUF1499 domain-containing protein [Verrucomicrobiota bacterium]
MAPRPPSSLDNGELLPCPGPPNCVCSQDNTPKHWVAPLRGHGSVVTAMARLKEIVRADPRTTILDSTPSYLRVEYRSRLFRFVDDVEFLANPPAGTIEVRSCSRVGYWDLGVNRRRIERLRGALEAALQSHPPQPGSI